MNIFPEKILERVSLIPEIMEVADKLRLAGFGVYLVGGCLRDLFLGGEPYDWDIATDATPGEIQRLFPESIYENNFGTVGIKTKSEGPRLKIIEVTTFRLEGKYTDKRHPDEVVFAKTIEEDLARRDFTVNAIAMPLASLKIKNQKSKIKTTVQNLKLETDDTKYSLIDPFGGLEDLKNGIICAVGNPEERFGEDALRLLRAVRLGAKLGFAIDPPTLEAIHKQAGLIEFIAKERIRDEFLKLIMTGHAHEGIEVLQKTGLLKRILPELEEGVGMGQNKHHIYSVFEHNVRALKYAVEQKFPLHVRLASLLHDVGKPRSKHGEGADCTFYGHQVVGERMVFKILDRLRVARDLTEIVALLVREHMFVYDPETVTLKGVRRLLQRVGVDNIDDLFDLREADRIGSGVPKAQPYRLRHLKAMVDKVKMDPVSAKMLKINGEGIMHELGIEPGPKVGAILAVLLEDVIENPELNTEEVLLKRVKELGILEEKELIEFAKKAKASAMQAQERIDGEILEKHFVKK
ncbi:MAG: HD domain-containing protein [Parcubacteria group bacterium]|nr:HD domain-containing protein [Parcubacteria group bacterium]